MACHQEGVARLEPKKYYGKSPRNMIRLNPMLLL